MTIKLPNTNTYSEGKSGEKKPWKPEENTERLTATKKVQEQGARPNIPVRYFMILIRKRKTYS
jgi:hypothetical protein